MKSGIHPELKITKVHCNGCGTSFTTKATVDSIEVEICSNCHPFYTGKQKLVDTAGRVDKFRARTEAAKKLKATDTKNKAAKSETEKVETDATEPKADPEMTKIAEEFKSETVDLPKNDKPTDS